MIVSAADRVAIVPSELTGTLNVVMTKAEVEFLGDACDEVLVFWTGSINGRGDWLKNEQPKKFQCPNRRTFFDALRIQTTNIPSGHADELRRMD